MRALYVHGFMIRNRADLVKMIKITKDAVNRSTLENLLAHADAAGIADDEARFLNYFGRTEDRRGAWARWLDHEAGTSGATCAPSTVLDAACSGTTTPSDRLVSRLRIGGYSHDSPCCSMQPSITSSKAEPTLRR